MEKKFRLLLLLALLLTAATGAWAQTEITTIPNGDFETWTYDGEDMPNYWNSNATSDGSMNGIMGGKQLKRSTDVRPGSSGQYSCSIWSKSTMGVINIGILTSGRIYFGATSSTSNQNYIYSDRDGSNTKNNFTNPCAMPFTGKPTAIKVWVKYVQGGTGYGNYATAKFSAIIHGDADYVAYNLAEHDNDDNKALVVASAEQEIAYNNGEWEQITIPFNYTDNDVAPAYILINAYTNAYPGKGKANDYLYIDDIELEYAAAASSGFTVSLKDGVKDADKWTVKVGDGQAQALPIGGLKGDGSETVTLQYTGRLKVKGVKATSGAAPAEEPVPMEFVEFTNGTKKVKFANMNLGATSVADGTSSYGDYYAWAATEPFGTVSYTAYNAGTVTATKEGGYSAANAPYRSGNTYSKYTSHGAILEAMDDAATVKMGEGYRMPTMDDFSTLCAACGGTDAEIYISSIATGAAYAKGIYWVAGAETAVTVGGDEYKTNGVLFVQDADHHIFFPMAGRVNSDNEFEYDGYYWSSTLITDTYSNDYDCAHYMCLNQYYVGHGNQYLTVRQLGFPIRPVQEVPAEATPALSITSPSVGQVIGSDGKNYAYGSLPSGVTAVAKICYVSGSNGLALALADEGKMEWSTAIETCAAHTAPFTGGTWKLASEDEWDNMIYAAGSYSVLCDGFISVGGTNMNSDDYYWSSTENGSDFAWYYDYDDLEDWDSGDKEYELYVRACLAFTVEQAAKPAATVTTAPTGAAVVSVGKTTELVSGGVADGGTLMYAVTTTNTKPTSTDGFSATVPTAQTITASGKVYVWYYVKGDDTHSDSEIAATAIEVPVADIVWDATNISDLDVWSTSKSYTKEGVKLSGNAQNIQAAWADYGDPATLGIRFNMGESGGFTFTAPTGKKFTKIEMNAQSPDGWYEANLGTGWAFNFDDITEISTVTWKGSAASTVGLLTGADEFQGAPVKSIAFYLSE